jgi:transcriptional regulator with XRE-family HTH domain
MATKTGVTNQQFADACGIHYSMSSLLRNGHRLPGADLLHTISKAYGLSLEDLYVARDKGAKAFGRFLTKHVFNA